VKVTFEADSAMERNAARITTHPDEQTRWKQVEEAVQHAEQTIVVINAKNNRNVQIPLGSVAVIESEDRMCGVRLISGERYLYNKRLKYVEEELEASAFVRINNRTIVNIRHVRAFSSTEHARIQIELADGSIDYVSRYYIKHFRRNWT